MTELPDGVSSIRDLDRSHSASSRALRQRRLGHRPVLVVAVSFAEHDRVVVQYGVDVGDQVARAVASAFTDQLTDSWILSDEPSGVVLVVPGHGPGTAERVLGRARAVVSAQRFHAGTELVLVTPVVGYASARDGEFATAQDRALDALMAAASRMDLVPVGWTPAAQPARDSGMGAASRELRDRYRLRAQIALTFILALGVPYALYVLAGRLHVARTATTSMYVLITLALLGTAASIYAESLAALDPLRPPDRAASELPSASAVIAAYLPNEAATILDTVRVFLNLEYAAGLQVILAYNSPEPLPVESALAELADNEDRFVLLKVADSTSKAQNVNAALQMVTGEIIGVFDADHHPASGSFERAWRWLSNGYGVVQGHCVIRNGASSWVSRTVAVEFESIYALSHPGRAQLHGFGIFGGSNGYWRADLLRQVRLRGTMLTEDIDSSLRVALRGQRIASDPGLISRELAPTRLNVLAGQRLRWAQGWSQVSLEYALSAIRSPRLSVRQKLGTTFLLCWREIYPWLSLQMMPLVAYVLLHRSSEPFNWFVPILMLSTLITFAAGPVQAALAYFVAVPEVRAHRMWFLKYALVNALFYTEFKNTLARVAHIKQFMGEEVWRVTVRDPSYDPVAVAELTAASGYEVNA
jgi:cellulose synthase/poly-beta-1,6-N-acetylglucosamine synthase-like glycosyltransferase/GGDEF domain-containing protein